MIGEQEQRAVTDARPQGSWHTRPESDVLAELNVQPDAGLSVDEAAKRLAQYGPNELEDRGAKNPLLILWEQITDPLVIVLLVAAAISAALGKIQELVAILAIVVINAILGVVQEYRAERAIQALKQLAAPMVRVRRGTQIVEVPSRELVPGDIILLESGNIIPADARLIESINLRIQEASLTGESVAVEKNIASIEDEGAPLGDRQNMAYMGTSVAYGRGTAVVVGTGMQSELGKIAEMIQNVEAEQTPLQRRMGEVGTVMFWAAVGVMFLAIVVGAIELFTTNAVQFTGEWLNETLLASVSIAVAVVPEGLPAVVTLTLALGTQRMLRRNALIRKLPAVETLGSVTVICSDKTGTLTENRMTVTMVDVPGESYDLTEALQTKLERGKYRDLQSPLQGLLLLSGALANDATIERVDDGQRDFRIQGDPTEGAIVLAAGRFGLVRHRLEEALPRIGEVPFSSERKLMTTVHEFSGQVPAYDKLKNRVSDILGTVPYVAFTKGAPDRLLDVCGSVWEAGEVHPMTDDYRQRIEDANAKMAANGLRVLGIAYRAMDALPEDAGGDKWEVVERDLTFVGLVGIIDPPRPEVKRAVEVCRTAGIRPVMITGDHPITARAIARDLNMIDDDAHTLTGTEIEAMTDEELRKEVEEVSVYARVSPEHKLRIVRALKDEGHIVAMTGDGVNDAPALKQASIGVAMSITGTDVSKEAADMVILDDNFATIVSAAEEGRTIYDNVRRFIKYLLASNTGELFVLLVTQAIPGMPLPLTTLQILWMNLITDGVPALALGVEQAEKNSMNRPPYEPNESVFGRGLGRHILIVGAVLGGTALALGLWAFNSEQTALNGAPAWNTMVFIMLTLAQMGHAFGLRSHRESVFTMNPLGNRFLLWALSITVLIQLSTIYLPFFNNLFGTNPLSATQLAICLVLSTVVFWAVEAEKLFIRRGVLKAS